MNAYQCCLITTQDIPSHTKQYSTNTQKHQKQRHCPTTEKDLSNKDKNYEITLTFEQMTCVLLFMSKKWFLIIVIPETLKKSPLGSFSGCKTKTEVDCQQYKGVIWWWVYLALNTVDFNIWSFGNISPTHCKIKWSINSCVLCVYTWTPSQTATDKMLIFVLVFSIGLWKLLVGQAVNPALSTSLCS